MNKFISENTSNVCFIAIKKILENGQPAFNIRGTGLLVEGKKIISCAHVYNEIPSDLRNSIVLGIARRDMDIITAYDFYETTLISKNDQRDIAIFLAADKENKLQSYGVRKETLMTEDEVIKLEPGTTINFAGFPLANEFLNMGMGVTFLISQCIIGAVKFSGNDKKIDFVLVDKQINPGNSGSPVFLNDKIIGLTSGTINQTHKIGESLINVPVGVGIVRTSNYILDLLKETDSK